MNDKHRETRDLAEAQERAARAREYAEKFPQFSHQNEPYCTVEWQLEMLTRYREKNASQKPL